MRMDRRRLFLFAALGVPVPARAQTYPSGPVRIVVGFPPGGPLDIAARTISPWLEERLGQPFEVVNQPGASGNNATRTVVKAEPDGRTLLLCGPVHAINTTLFDTVDFDFGRDIAPVAGIARVPLVIEVHPTVPARSLAELVALARGEPGRLRVAYAGVGTPQHVGIELFKRMAGIDLTLVPYLGSEPALTDLLQGKVDVMFDPVPSSMPHLRAGRIIPLATTGPARAPALPDVPAASEFLPGYEAGSWFGLGAPRNTPAAIVEQLSGAVEAALTDPRLQARLLELGATPMPLSPGMFGRYVGEETEKYRRIIREANIRLG